MLTNTTTSTVLKVTPCDRYGGCRILVVTGNEDGCVGRKEFDNQASAFAFLNETKDNLFKENIRDLEEELDETPDGYELHTLSGYHRTGFVIPVPQTVYEALSLELRIARFTATHDEDLTENDGRHTRDALLSVSSLVKKYFPRGDHLYNLLANAIKDIQTALKEDANFKYGGGCTEDSVAALAGLVDKYVPRDMALKEGEVKQQC